jgi:hypothetical protein
VARLSGGEYDPQGSFLNRHNLQVGELASIALVRCCHQCRLLRPFRNRSARLCLVWSVLRCQRHN